MKISTIASILVWAGFIAKVEGYLRPMYFGSDACQISYNYRMRCGTQHMSRHICEAMGCCYQYTIYGSWCYYSKLSYTFFPPSQGSNRVNSLPSTIRTTRATTTTTTTPVTTTTTPPTTTVQTTTPISAALNENEVRKQSKPNADLLELLSRLAAMHRAAQSKEEAPTRPRAQSVNTTEPIEAYASGVVSSNPVSRGAIPQNESETSTCLFNPEEREDCGFPGITKVRCESMGCCWNSTLDGVYWCFFSVLVSEELVPPPLVNNTSLDLDADSPSWRNNLNMDYSEEELIEPPLPPNIDDDDNFLALVAQEISGEEPPDVVEDNNSTVSTYNLTINGYNNATNTSVSPLTVFPAVLSVLNTTTRTLVRTETPTTQSTTQTSTTLSEPPWLQQLLSNHEPTATTTTTAPVTTTTPTSTTTTEEDLPPYTDPIVHAVSPQVNTVPAPTAGLSEIAALLKILQGMERQTPQQASHECRVDAQDECCRNDPTAPCCEYQTHRDLAHRAAPMARIVGGGPAGLLRFSVAYLSKNSLSTQFCGGTWIDNQWVLTAAHCVLDYCSRARPVSELMVSLGKYRKLSFQRDVGQLDLRVIDVICHPTNCKTAGQPRLNDLALLRLERPVQTNSYYTPAPMPLSFEAPAPQGNCIVLGWGSTQGTGHDNVLKEVSVPLVTNEQCNRRDWRNCVIRACMMCAGELSNDPCDGDSGGPLFCQRPNGLYVLHGIYSWGRCGAEERKPAVYTRASYFIDWINRVINTFGGR